MATYFAIGGGNWTWTSANTANFSLSSNGGTAGVAPTAADTVIFDSNSTTGIVTWSTGVCLTLNCTGGTGNFAGTLGNNATVHSIPGSFILSPTMTYSGTGGITMSATTTGFSFSMPAGAGCTQNVTFNGSGGGWTLTANSTTTGQIGLTLGTITLGGFSLSCFNFSSSNSNVRTLDISSSTLNLTGTGTVWTTATSTNLTFTVTGSTVNITDTSSTTKTLSSPGRTFNNLNIGGGSGSTVSPVAFNGAASVTINGTLSNNSGAPYNLTLPANITIATINLVGSSTQMSSFGSTVAGTSRTVTLTNASTASYTYLQDTKISTANLSGSYLFNAGNNTTTAGGTITWGNGSPIQVITGSAGSGTGTVATAFPANNTAGSAIKVMVVTGTTVTTTTVTDTQGNTYAQITGSPINSGTYEMTGWIAYNVKAGANTITTASGGLGTAIAFVAAEIAGVYTASNPIDQITSTISGSTGDISVTTGTTTSFPETAIILGGSEPASTTLTAGSGWLFLTKITASNIFQVQAYMAFQLILSNTTVTGTINQSGSQQVSIWTDTLFLSGYVPPPPFVITTHLLSSMGVGS